MSGIDSAAAAFDADSGTGKTSGAKEVVSVEDIFHNSLKGVEVDEGSPEMGGGDDTLPEGVDPKLVREEERPRRRTARKPAEEDEQDDEADLYVDPDDPEDDEEDPDDEEDEDDDEDDDDGGEADVLGDDAMDKLVEITVDGEKKKVKLREAVDGYIRTDTFHQRLNGLHEARQLLEGEAHKVVARRVETNNLFSELEEAMKAILPKDVDWDKLYAENPVKARQLQKSYEEVEQKIEGLRAKRDKLNKDAEAEDQGKLRTYIASEAEKFASSNPHWRGQDGAVKRQKDLESMARTAQAAGFSKEEILQTYDSRMLQVLLKASKYDRMVAARPKPNKGKTPARPGAGRGTTAPRGTRRPSAPTGGSSIERAGAVFTELIKPRR